MIRGNHIVYFKAFSYPKWPVQLYTYWMALMTINKSNSFTWIALAASVQFGRTRSIYFRIVQKTIQYEVRISKSLKIAKQTSSCKPLFVKNTNKGRNMPGHMSQAAVYSYNIWAMEPIGRVDLYLSGKDNSEFVATLTEISRDAKKVLNFLSSQTKSCVFRF